VFSLFLLSLAVYFCLNYFVTCLIWLLSFICSTHQVFYWCVFATNSQQIQIHMCIKKHCFAKYKSKTNKINSIILQTITWCIEKLNDASIQNTKHKIDLKQPCYRHQQEIRMNQWNVWVGWGPGIIIVDFDQEAKWHWFEYHILIQNHNTLGI